MVGVTLAPGLEGSHVGLGDQRTGGAGVRQDHRGVRIEDPGSFSHETDTGKNDDVRFGIAGKQGQFQTVANLVGHALDVGCRVIVGQSHDTGHDGSLR